MNRWLIAVAVVALVSPAFAQTPPPPGKPAPAPVKPAPAVQPAKAPQAAAPQAQPAAPQAPAMDMSKIGPWSRKPANEAQTKKEIQDFFKKHDEIGAKGDFDAMVAEIDFPVFMATDGSNGAVQSKAYSKDEYVAMMKPMMEHMPKDAKVTSRPMITVLSDSLASVVVSFSMKVGKQRLSGKNAGLLVKVGGQWKWKLMAEAGWGDAPHGSAPAATATNK